MAPTRHPAAFLDSALGAAAAAERSRQREAEWLPAPGMDREGAPPLEELAAREQSILRRAIPPLRSRWAELDQADRRLAILDAHAAEVTATVERLHEQLRVVDTHDAVRLQAWIDDGRKGERPAPRRRDLEDALHAAEVEGAALARSVEAAEVERVNVITRHRRVLVRDATELVEERLEAARAALAAAERAREELTEAAALRLWARLFPHESASTVPPYGALGAGLPNPLASVADAATLYTALRADLDQVKDTLSSEQRALLVRDGEVEERVDDGAAHWVGTEQGKRVRDAEHERLLGLFRQEYGRDPLNQDVWERWVHEQLEREREWGVAR
jgi:hypothetical protein